MSSANCLTPSLLKDYALGRLTEEESSDVEQHLLDCPSCEETAANLDDTADSLDSTSARAH